MGSKYEKYVTRKAFTIHGPDDDGAMSFKIPNTYRISKDETTTGPRQIFSNDIVKEAALKYEYGWIMRDMTLMEEGGDYGAHKHDFAEIFVLTGNDPYDTSYLGAECEFWMGEGDDLEKIEFDTSCSIYVPANVGHFPMFIRNVKTPIMLSLVMLDVADVKRVPVSRSGDTL